MKQIILGVAFLIMTNIAWGSFKPLKVTKLNVDYREPRGSATANDFSVPGLQGEELSNYKFKIFKEGNGFRLVYSKGEYLIENVPPFIASMERLQLRTLNMKASRKKATLTFRRLSGTSEKGKFQTKNVSLECFENKRHRDEVDRYLDACTTNGVFKFSELLSSKGGGSFLAAVLNKSLGKSSDKADGVDLKNFQMTIKKNDFKLTTKVKYGSSYYNVTGRGATSYKRNRVAIRIDKVSAGFFNITNRVFEELEKVKSKFIRVERPYVYLKIIR